MKQLILFIEIIYLLTIPIYFYCNPSMTNLTTLEGLIYVEILFFIYNDYKTK